MNPRRTFPLATGIAVFAFLAVVTPAFAKAKRAKLRIKVSPQQAYVFVDGKALKQGDCDVLHLCTIHLDPGEHTVTVRNYGYSPVSKKVDLQTGKTTKLDIKLPKNGGPVKGPWGRIQIKGPGHAAVLLNGKSPDYFVGHVDEVNNSFIWQQELLVPPGHYDVTVTWWGNEVWSGPVDVKPNERVVIKTKKGSIKTHPFKKGKKLASKEIPRFKGGIASTRIAVAPTTGKFSANPTQLKCGESSTLNWSSNEAVETQISGIGKVDNSGNKTVQPTQTTTYDFTASGPGGIVKQSATVDVDNSVQASLTANPTEVRYHKVGNKVVEQGSTTLSWSTTNAQSVSIDPFGTVEANGSRTETPTPTQSGYGPVNETKTYTLKATNNCGGNATETASVHIVGLIEREHVKVVLTSVFFPTAWPERLHPHDGLLQSQKSALDRLAQTFKAHHEAEPDSRLLLEAHADRRGSKRSNQLLSERRAQIVKDYLVSQGIDADLIELKAFGETQNLNLNDVKQLESKNPNAAPQVRHWLTEQYAHNRRVDTVLQPDNLRSTPYYPHNAPDAKVLEQRPVPSLRHVKRAE